MPARPNPRLWASKRPFGIGLTRPNNYFEVFRAAVAARRHPRYAWNVLSKGVCDGCALGTKGMKDWTIEGTHLCNVRLRLLDLNVADPMDHSLLADAGGLAALSNGDLRKAGRLAHPMLRRAGDRGFSRISWDGAMDLVAERVRDAGPDRVAAYLTSRGMANEGYYAAQKAMRAIGSPHVDNAARVCHSPSAYALRDAFGVTASTCSYGDIIGTDLVVFVGSNPANNQPVMMKYLLKARRNGARVVCVNPFREPGMERYWVPSDPESALFGTKITDRWFQVGIGGDIPFLTGVLKAMVEDGHVDRNFVTEHANGFDAVEAAVGAIEWDRLESGSGLDRDAMRELAAELGRVSKAVFVWSMGVTQNTRGEDAIAAIINLAMTRGFVGREGCGLMPIRGHSGVQGGAEMGCYAKALPGAIPVDADSASHLSGQWGFPVPAREGMTAPEMLDAARSGDLDVLLSVGGNFLDVMPSPAHAEEALGRIPLRVHMDVVVNRQMLVEPGREVLLLPATTRYEIEGGVTETTTERRVVLSPAIPGGPGRIPEARPEWMIFGDLAARIRPDLATAVSFPTTSAIREEISRVVGGYGQISDLTEGGDSFQIGGPRLCEGWRFATDDGRARFRVVDVEATRTGDGGLVLSTRRGKQFNSMVQSERDQLTGLARDAVLISEGDASARGLADGDRVVVSSTEGSLPGTIAIGPIARGSVQVMWPEGNVLLPADVRSPRSGIPDYNATVEVVRAQPAVEPPPVS